MDIAYSIMICIRQTIRNKPIGKTPELFGLQGKINVSSNRYMTAAIKDPVRA